MGYASNQPYTSNAPTSQAPQLGGNRYGNYNGARFANMGVGNSMRYGTQFKPGQQPQYPQQPQGPSYGGPQRSQPFGTGPSQMSYGAPAPQGNPLGRAPTQPSYGGNPLGEPVQTLIGWNGQGQDPNQYGFAPQGNPLGGTGQPPPPSGGGLGRPQAPQAPQAPQQWGPNANPLLASYIGASDYAPQQSNGYSFADQEAQLRRMYGF